MCGGFVGDVIDTVGGAVGDAVGFVGDTVGNVVEGVMSGDPKSIALVALAAVTAQPEILAELGVAEGATAATMMAEDAAGLAAQGLTQAQIAETLGASYGIDAAAATQIAGTATGSLAATDAVSNLGMNAQVFDDGSSILTNANGQSLGGIDSAGSAFNAGDTLGGAAETNFGGGLANAGDVQNLFSDGLTSQVFDDGSTLFTDANGNVISGTDATGAEFTVKDGIGTYADGTQLGGEAVKNFGGALANPADVQSLLDYNAGLTSGGLSNLPKIPSMGTGTPTGGGSGGSNVTNVTVAAPAAATPTRPTMPNLTGETIRANTNFNLTGMPSFGDNPIIYKADGGLSMNVYAEGGDVQEHNPEFFSEGGLSLANRYVKGEGDGTSDSVPAMLATGEFVIPADVVSGLGNGDNDSGAQILDEFLKVIRSHKRSTDDRELPPDSKGALGYLQEAMHKVA